MRIKGIESDRDDFQDGKTDSKHKFSFKKETNEQSKQFEQMALCVELKQAGSADMASSLRAKTMFELKCGGKEELNSEGKAIDGFEKGFL